MKRILAVIFSMIIMVMVFPVCAGAAESLKAPTVQFQIINHDKVALRWSEVDGADHYYVYRTDVKTGKTVKYKDPVEGTTTQITGLKAETDYIFQVAAVSEKDGQIIVGKRSKGTKVTTPGEWIYKYSKSSNGHYWTYRYFKQNYDGSHRQLIDLGNVKSVDDILYYNGWVYFTAYGRIGRIKEGDTSEEILYGSAPRNDYGIHGPTVVYDYKARGDYIYIYRQNIPYGFNNGVKDTRVVDLSEYQKLSLKTGEVTDISDVYFSYDFDVLDDYIYYIYDECTYDEKKDGYVFTMGNDIYLCRIKNDGTEQERICQIPSYDYNMAIYNGDVYLYAYNNGGDVYKVSLADGEMSLVYIDPYNHIRNFEIVNDYVYFTVYHSSLDKEPSYYCRVKTDGTKVTKSNKPFEWKY